MAKVSYGNSAKTDIMSSADVERWRGCATRWRSVVGRSRRGVRRRRTPGRRSSSDLGRYRTEWVKVLLGVDHYWLSKTDQLSASSQFLLTLSNPVMQNSYPSKCWGSYWSNPAFLVFFWHSGTLALRTERQSTRMSKKLKRLGLTSMALLLWSTHFCHN